MKLTLFCHSLVSDWNHGNAHFLRGVVRELQRRGHDVDVLEPEGAWSRRNLVAHAGEAALSDFARAFPDLRSRTYAMDGLDLDRELADSEIVLVHDWIEPAVLEALGRHRRRHDYTLLFYDAHHRAASAPQQIERFDLSAVDAVLAFGSVIRDLYLHHGWARRAYVWHEAADTHLFYPRGHGARADLVWIGNWGDGERSEELQEYLLSPARALGLSGRVHGVRYPAAARRAVEASGLQYRDWLPNHRVPEVFARHRMTVHVPRRAYVRLLPGIPTIRMFEALACGIPLVSAPWEDRDGLFSAGVDYLQARSGAEMTEQLRMLRDDPVAADRLASSGLETIRARHTCAHRVDELLEIAREVA